jgi:signal transduction histidine kinase
VRLSDLPRTTSFRLSVLFLTLFGVASLALFGFLYWQTAAYLTNSIDDELHEDLSSYLATPDELMQRLLTHRTRDPDGRRPFGLFDSSGRLLAGNLTELPNHLQPLDRLFEFRLPVQGGHHQLFRGLAHRLPDGRILIISENVHEIHEFKELLRNAMAWGGVLMLAAGLAGAIITGLGAVRRINGITGAIERIVNGDLAKRLPTHGGDGDLDRLAHVVNGMLNDIERLMREVKGVTDDIAHDLRTPLTRLLGGLERVRRRGGTAEDYAVAIDEAIAETKDVLRTFSALLRIAEVEDGARRAGFARIELRTIAGDVVEFHAPVAEERGISLTLEADPAVATELSGDPSLMFEAVSNLVDNAIKFAPVGGHVSVRAFRSRGRLGIMVSDDGPGIPEGERDAVLRRFHRLEKSRHTPGSGLGLSLVAAIAKLHGLTVTIESANPGSCITLAREESREESPPSTSPALQAKQEAHAISSNA